MKFGLRSNELIAEKANPPDRRSRHGTTTSRSFSWPIAVGLVAIALCLPFFRYVSWLGDEGVILHGAERILRGDRIYVDFFEFLPPGAFFITASWFSVTGISIFSARILAILTIAGTACFTYLTCRQASKDELPAAFIAVGWVVLIPESYVQVLHQWFATLVIVVAMWLTFLDLARPRCILGPVTVGIATGAAAMVTPNRGAFAMLSAATLFLNWRRHRARSVAFLGGAILAPVGTLTYLILQGALRAGFEDVVLFTATRYTFINRVPFGWQASFPLKWLFPLAAVLALFTCARDWRRCLYDRVFRTCVAFGLAGFIGCFPRPDHGHLAFAVPLVCPLLAYCISEITGNWATKYLYATGAAAVAFLFPAAHSLEWWARTAWHGKITSSPRGEVVLVPPGAPALIARIAALPPGDGYFFYPYDAMLPVLTARRQVSKYDLLTPSYSLPSQYQEACVSVMRDATWVVIDRDLTNPRTLIGSFPSMRDPEPPETKRFEQALEIGFELITTEGIFELRHRAPAIDKTVCDAIADGSDQR